MSPTCRARRSRSTTTSTRRTSAALAEDVLDGLTRPFKELPPKHFYDARGCELFDRITELPEYYPTRAERAILQERSEAIVAATGAAELVELGSGTAAKTRVLLDAMAAAGQLRRYVPFDVAERSCATAPRRSSSEYPGLRVHGVIGDFERHLDRIPPPTPASRGSSRFLGGTIGNFPPGSRAAASCATSPRCWAPTTACCSAPTSSRTRATIEAAYDDAAGVTAEFNRNVLHVLNRELDADFDARRLRARRLLRPRATSGSRCALRARRGVRRAGRRRSASTSSSSAGEEIRTEISAKFTRERVEEDFAAAGLRLDGWHTDTQQRFALSLGAPA